MSQILNIILFTVFYEEKYDYILITNTLKLSLFMYFNSLNEQGHFALNGKLKAVTMEFETLTGSLLTSDFGLPVLEITSTNLISNSIGNSTRIW